MVVYTEHSLLKLSIDEHVISKSVIDGMLELKKKFTKLESELMLRKKDY